MHQEKIESWNMVMMGESLLFGLLGKAIYGDPDKDWLESLIRDDVFAEVPFGNDQPEIRTGLEILQRWTKENCDGMDNTEFGALKQDQLRLFIGIDKVLAPVWESVYFNENRLVFQAQTLQVREWYRRFGLRIERFNREPDDHIGLELSFIAHMAVLGMQALEEGDDAKFDGIIQSQREFLSQHLLCWGPAWARLVEKQAETDFYRGLAHLTQGALLAVASSLQIEMPKEVSL